MRIAVYVCACVCVCVCVCGGGCVGVVLTNIVLVVHVFGVEYFKQSFLDECLLVERSFVLDDFNGHPLLLLQVKRLHHLWYDVMGNVHYWMSMGVMM